MRRKMLGMKSNKRSFKRKANMTNTKNLKHGMQRGGTHL